MLWRRFQKPPPLRPRRSTKEPLWPSGRILLLLLFRAVKIIFAAFMQKVLFFGRNLVHTMRGRVLSEDEGVFAGTDSGEGSVVLCNPFRLLLPPGTPVV